jgi:hypothetical protein
MSCGVLTAVGLYAHVQEDLWVHTPLSCKYYKMSLLFLEIVAKNAVALVVFEGLRFLLKRTQWYQYAAVKRSLTVVRVVWWLVSCCVALLMLFVYSAVWVQLFENEQQLLAGEQNPELVAAGVLAGRAD